MRNARKYDDRITLGLVPDSEDLEQLKSLGYRTLVDVRDEQEKFGGLVEKRALKLGLRYVNVPIDREEIGTEELEKFYQALYEKGAEPLYVFSRYGRKPLAFLLLLEAVAKGDPLYKIFQKARRFGLGGLDGDLSLQSFLVNMINSPSLKRFLEVITRDRPGLFGEARSPSVPPASQSPPEDLDEPKVIEAGLAQAASLWEATRDKSALRARLRDLLGRLGE